MGLNLAGIKFRGLLNLNFFEDFVDGELRNYFPIKRKNTKLNTVDLMH